MIGGRLTRDPEMKSLPSGSVVTSFSLATSSSRKGKDGGERIEETEYHNITVFGKQAESSAQYLKKGQVAFVEGRLKTRSWEKDGVKQYKTEIIADRVQFGPKTDGAQKAPRTESSGPGDYSQKKKASPSVLPDYPEDEINAEDIPF